MVTDGRSTTFRRMCRRARLQGAAACSSSPATRASATAASSWSRRRASASSARTRRSHCACSTRRRAATGRRSMVRRDGDDDRHARRASPANSSRSRCASNMAAPMSSSSKCRALPGELTAINNKAVVTIEGVRDQLKVLLVSGEPHAGERTWRNLLKSDANVDLVHFTILRPPEKQDGTPINELSLIAFPDRRSVRPQDQRFRPDHLRPLFEPERAAAGLFRQYRALCARRRRVADRRRAGFRRRPTGSIIRRSGGSRRRGPTASVIEQRVSAPRCQRHRRASIR